MDTTEVRSQVRSRAEKMKTSQPQRDMNSGQLFKKKLWQTWRGNFKIYKVEN